MKFNQSGCPLDTVQSVQSKKSNTENAVVIYFYCASQENHENLSLIMQAGARLAWLARRRLRFQHGLHLASTWLALVRLDRESHSLAMVLELEESRGFPLLMLPWISTRICCNTTRNVWLYTQNK